MISNTGLQNALNPTPYLGDLATGYPIPAPTTSTTESLESTQINTNEQHRRDWPKAINLPRVFPSYLCGIIVKSAGRAHIRLLFPANPAECSLNLHISATQVPYVARELYGVHVNVENEKRFIITRDGVEIEIHGSFTLRRALNIPIPTLFGHQVGMAYRRSPRYKEEQYNGEDLTRCVSMVVEGQANMPGHLRLMIDEENLTSIAEDLWRD
jgi:hypothetical protein